MIAVCLHALHGAAKTYSTACQGHGLLGYAHNSSNPSLHHQHCTGPIHKTGLTSMKVSSSTSSLLGVPGWRGTPPPPAPGLGAGDVVGRPEVCRWPRPALVALAAIPGTVISMVLRGRCRSPATAWGATPTDKSPVPLSSWQNHLE